ncbi:hypothetical protein B0T19DRAFT_436948 [Cercophora scortea]|uniref:Uncharacterized protein n=1 Tax=Cercophora scortea TaxID=314031 RepID=A0AAE0J3E1_9PEZI|nr:hypothetical protein B0T19DRAFT_436948 [Cercophora scortea]
MNGCYCANYYVSFTQPPIPAGLPPHNTKYNEGAAAAAALFRLQKGSINCRNSVSKFGDRCKLCLALKSGASLKGGLLPEEGLWMDGPSAAAAATVVRKRKDSSSRSSAETSPCLGDEEAPEARS